jgi:hypothetical protein
MWLVASHRCHGVQPPDALGHFDTFEQALTGSNSLQPTHGAHPVFDWHVRAFDGFRGYSACAMQAGSNVQCRRHVLLNRADIRLVLVGNDHHRGDAAAADGLLEEGFGAGQVTLLAQEHIHHLTVVIDGSVQVPPDVQCGHLIALGS